MMHALLKLQNSDGLWRSSLLDPQDPMGESSGSSFFVDAMTWGINRGLLPAETFRPAVMNGYQALAKNILPTGMLGFVQKIGEEPDKQDTTAESTEIDGSGAFLLAGAEVIRLLDSSKRQSNLTTFKAKATTFTKSAAPAAAEESRSGPMASFTIPTPSSPTASSRIHRSE